MKTKLVPMLFNTDMAVAMRKNLKTQTRRGRGLDLPGLSDPETRFVETMIAENGDLMAIFFNDKTAMGYAIKSPYGRPGDIMWMREAYYVVEIGNIKQSFMSSEVNTEVCDQKLRPGLYIDGVKANKKPNMHMPLKYATVFRRITDIRIERLQDISEADAEQEGVSLIGKDGFNQVYRDYLSEKKKQQSGGFFTAKRSFISLIQAINGVEFWDINPWVWVVEFERHNLPRKQALEECGK